MKKFGTLLLAAVLGSAITTGIFYFAGNFDNNKKVKIEYVNKTPAKGVLYTADENGEIIPLDFTKVAEKSMEAVVNIKSSFTYAANGQFRQQDIPEPFKDFFGDEFFRYFGPQGQHGQPGVRVATGSGVIISADGYIVTNNHVVADADDIEVTLHDNRTFKAKVIGTDPSTDLALLQIKAKELPYLPMVNSDEVKVGEWVLAIGNPFNLNSTVTAGIVSAKARNINILKDRSAIESFIQTDAAINPGNSGGALINLEGGLIGINTAIASPTGAYAGYGFAIPANIVKKVVDDLIKYGSVQRGYLGILIRDVDGNLAKEKDLDVTEGVYVDSLMEKSAAAKAGIKQGDVILEVNGKKVNSSPELQEIVGRHRPGDKLNITVDRKGSKKQFTVTLQNRDGNTSVVKGNNSDIATILGAQLETIDKKTAKKLEIDGGVRVKKLYPGKLRKYTTMKEGFIITKADGKDVNSVEELSKILKNKKGGVLLEGVYEDLPGVFYYAFGL